MGFSVGLKFFHHQRDILHMALHSKFLWHDIFGKQTQDQEMVATCLKSSQIFSRLNDREIKYLSTFVHLRHYEPGEIIFEQHERGLGMYFIAKGAVEIKLQATDNQNEELLVTTLNQGSFFGELALIDQDNQRSASAYAQGQVSLVGFFKPDLLDIMDQRPQMGVDILFQLSKVLSKRLTETTEVIRELTKHNYSTENYKGPKEPYSQTINPDQQAQYYFNEANPADKKPILLQSKIRSTIQNRIKKIKRAA